ncbi:putative Major facilitator superfamily MFS_1 [Candidatus Terasakiella magnetica]|uniref:Putative Major facilitator superfamily MFS_1 n=1 Tax=Candidatus Terasakiella magnetica TaxID=1867952 RepID=A0A1C3RFW9_9PROT|nr:YbfB/YjiJ family MFS transporter [Candidatus Terasakiella magnetica]SCA56155.1 putative Major facilitator superfamily MFS_1 [Candidatus Terasakiella magnetica]
MSQPIATWKLICAGISSLILVMGIARFALTPLLPAMQAATGLGDDGAGFLAASNYAGYLSGALLASRLRNPLTKLRFYRLGIIFAVLTTAAMALSDHVVIWSIMRYFGGLTSAAGMVVGTAIVLDHLKQRHRPDYIGIHFSGVGLGVVLSGTVLTLIEPVMSWDQGWLVVGAIGLLLALPALLWMNIHGLKAPNIAHGEGINMRARPIIMLLLSYGFAGATFSIGTTFIITIMAQSPSLADSRNLAWVLLGVALAPSCYFWMRSAIKVGDFKALTYAYIVQAIGCALPVLWPSTASALIGGFMFGACFMGIVTVVLALGGKLSPHNPSALIGILVVSYGVGQIVGPVLAGIAMEQTGFSELGLWSAAACSLISIAFLWGARCPSNVPVKEDCPCLS